MQQTSHPVIFGTDFSDNAHSAARAAAALAVRFEKQLLLVHVAQLCDERFSIEERERELQPLEARLRKEAVALESSGARIEQAVLRGGWAENALIRLANEWQPSLMVVSSVSKTAFDRWTLGSVSERLAEAAATPTLVVRSPEPLIAWAEGKRPLRILVAADFSPTADAALCWADKLREFGPCDITAGHIYWPLDESRRLGFKESISLTENPAELQAAVEKHVTNQVHGQLDHTETKILVRANWGRPDAPVIEMARAAQADLLVVGTHQRQGVSRIWRTSTSRGVLHHAPMNVAVIPAPREPRRRIIPRVQRVLVAIDFSEVAGRVVAQAFAALPGGGVVRLLHVLRETDRSEAENKLRDLIPEGAAARGVETETEIVEAADEAKAISEAAERFEADLVCVGSHGRGGILSTVLGSVTHGLLARCLRPVLVVRSVAE